MKRIALIILSLIILQTCNFAEESVTKVCLDDAIKIALKNNIDLKKTKLNIDIAKNEIRSANKLLNPSVDAFYFWGGPGNYEPRQVGLSQKIEIAKRSARKDLAKSGLKLTEKNVDYTEFDLKMDVREAYINLVAAKSILNTLEQQEQLQRELLEIAEARVKASMAPEIDEIQAEIALNQMMAQVNTARVNVKAALAAFNKVINTTETITYDSIDKLFDEENNYDEMDTPEPSSDFPEVHLMVKKGLAHRFDIQIAKQEIEYAEKNLTVVLRQRVPNLQISGGYAYIPGRYMNSGHFGSGAYTGVSIEDLPVFYNYSPEIKNASHKLEQAKINYISVRNKAEKDIKTAYERFLTAADNLNRYEFKIVTDSAKLIDSSKKSYESGKSDITSLIVMKQSYKSIIIGYTQALTDYYNSWTNFLREINDEDYELCDCL